MIVELEIRDIVIPQGLLPRVISRHRQRESGRILTGCWSRALNLTRCLCGKGRKSIGS